MTRKRTRFTRTLTRTLALSAAALATLWVSEPWAAFGLGGPIEDPGLKTPVVAELFTSQSCSSCPPADEVLGELAAFDNVIALGCHVTYWDHLNWKDTLSLPACTERQRAYAREKGSGRVYTPQMVINGRAEFVGSNRFDTQRQLDAARGQVTPLALEWLDEGPGRTLSVTLPALKALAGQNLTLWLAAIGPDRTQSVRSGENGGKTLHYVHPVSALAPVGAWDGQAETRQIALPDGFATPDTTGLALLVHEGNSGPIQAAGLWAR